MGEQKKSSRRFRPNYLYTVISTSLVLFMLGILAFVFSSGKKLANEFKEKLEFTVIIKDNADQKKVTVLTDTLSKQPWVKSADYVSKQQAAESFIKETGEDFTDLLDYNPLFASINLKLYSGYTSQDSIDKIEKIVSTRDEVSEFYYDHKLVTMMNNNLRKIGWIIIGLCVLLMIVAITLIDSTIRLSMYANRMLIRSMQLVGATRSFITKPFLSRSILNGVIASGIAIILLFAVMKFANTAVNELQALEDWKTVVVIFTGILAAGILFSYVSTQRAVRKYLRMRLEELY